MKARTLVLDTLIQPPAPPEPHPQPRPSRPVVPLPHTHWWQRKIRIWWGTTQGRTPKDNLARYRHCDGWFRRPNKRRCFSDCGVPNAVWRCKVCDREVGPCCLLSKFPPLCALCGPGLAELNDWFTVTSPLPKQQLPRKCTARNCDRDATGRNRCGNCEFDRDLCDWHRDTRGCQRCTWHFGSVFGGILPLVGEWIQPEVAEEIIPLTGTRGALKIDNQYIEFTLDKNASFQAYGVTFMPQVFTIWVALPYVGDILKLEHRNERVHPWVRGVAQVHRRADGSIRIGYPWEFGTGCNDSKWETRTLQNMWVQSAFNGLHWKSPAPHFLHWNPVPTRVLGVMRHKRRKRSFGPPWALNMYLKKLPELMLIWAILDFYGAPPSRLFTRCVWSSGEQRKGAQSPRERLLLACLVPRR